MNRRDLANIVAEQLCLSRSTSSKAVNLVFDAIHEELIRNRRVSISGFGSFEMTNSSGITSNGEPVRSRQKQPKFSPSRRLGRVEESV